MLGILSKAKMCSFFSQQGRKNLNLLVLEVNKERDILSLIIELKRQNSQANRSITSCKDSNISLWQSQAKLIF